jgi:hypothetical protein
MAKPEPDHAVEEFAEELGRLLESAQAKAKDWLGQRQQIAKTLEVIRDTATRLLHQLGHDGQRSGQRGGRPGESGGDRGRLGARTRSGKKGSGRTRRVMSAEARERIRQAQLRRWAKQRAAAKKK